MLPQKHICLKTFIFNESKLWYSRLWNSRKTLRVYFKSVLKCTGLVETDMLNQCGLRSSRHGYDIMLQITRLYNSVTSSYSESKLKKHNGKVKCFHRLKKAVFRNKGRRE